MNFATGVIRHHSYRLAGGTPAMPFKDAIVKKLGSQHSADLMMNQVGTAGRSEGLIYNFDGMMFGDTEDAHTLLVAARKAGIADAVEERFITAVSPKVALSLIVSSSLQWP